METMLAAAKRTLQKVDFEHSYRDDFSIEEFSKKAVENLGLAMGEAREKAIQSDR